MFLRNRRLLTALSVIGVLATGRIAIHFTGPNATLIASQRTSKTTDSLPTNKQSLEFATGEKIALIGNSTAERMNLYGHFESRLHTRFPNKKLVVRNFARPAEQVSIHQRSNDYTKIDDPMQVFSADTYIVFFGWNESFAGPGGVEKFKADYEKFLDEQAAKYPRTNKGGKPRFVLVSPVAFEPTNDKHLPSGEKENTNLKLYADAVAAVAGKRGLKYADIFTPTLETFSKTPGMQFTINGVHLNEAGDREVGSVLEEKLFGSATTIKDKSAFEKLRAAVIDKAWYHMQDYRMVNGWYVYGSRRTFDHETFPKEYQKIRNMVAVRDQHVWDVASGKKVADKPDDSKTGELFVPPTRFGDPKQNYSEAKELRYLSPADFIKSCTVAPGMEIKLFADESMFPELAKPVQMSFDNKGRLWVACMPTYPGWKPGDPKPSDKLIILEDTDGDGKADKCKVFYDKLHCATGFEFCNGGVLVMDQPRMLFLKDTDGDDKADEVTYLLDGWATDDTHHRGGWEWNNGGQLHILEGIAMSTTLETAWGPLYNLGGGGAYVFDPRSQAMRQFNLNSGMYNMWCYVFDEWGQGIVGDGTTANHAWDTPLSGAQFGGRKGMNFVFNNDGLRPALGCEWLVSRNLPDEVQKQFTYACVINMNGMPRFTVNDDGAGFSGKRIGNRNKLDDLIRSTDKHFRPADPQIGPDGALWFGDWANALIGHMQYSQRDPNRDHSHGRIYRLVGKDKPLVKPVTQFGKSIPELLEQFREYEWRTRYRARRELWSRPIEEVAPALKTWLAKLDPKAPETDRLKCEALWLQQSFHAVDAALLQDVLSSKTYQARAAAVHVLAEERNSISNAIELLKKAATDQHPRVRTEAVRGLSFVATTESMDAVLAATKLPMDYYTKYTIEAALNANANVWRPAFISGKIEKDYPTALPMLNEILASDKLGAAVQPHLRLLLGSEPRTVEERNKAMSAIAALKGDPKKGEAVFLQSCIACHRTGKGQGQDYGPNMEKVGTRLTKMKIIESIIDPNAEVDQKYQTTRIITADGKSVSGLLVSETKTEVVIFDGKEKKTIKVDDIEKRTVLKQSSMPEGQAGVMAPSQFVDLVEYLFAQK